MSTLQVHGVSEKLHHVLESRAADAGMSLSQYIIRELQVVVAGPTDAESTARALADGVAGQSGPHDDSSSTDCPDQLYADWGEW
jgi:hypothetical protein